MADRDALPRQGDCIEITWLASRSTDHCMVQSITHESLTVMYMDNGDIEELDYEEGHLPFGMMSIAKLLFTPLYDRDFHFVHSQSHIMCRLFVVIKQSGSCMSHQLRNPNLHLNASPPHRMHLQLDLQ